MRLTEMFSRNKMFHATLLMTFFISVTNSFRWSSRFSYLDRIDVDSIRAFEEAWLAHIKGSCHAGNLFLQQSNLN